MASLRPRPDQQGAEPAPVRLASRETPGRRRPGQRATERRVAVVPGDLLDHVDLGRAVEAPRRDLDVVVVPDRGGREADRVEQLGDARRSQVGAEQAGDPCRAHADGWADPGSAPVAHGRTILQRCAEQLGEPAHRQVDDLRVRPLLEAGRGLGAELVAAGRLHDADGVEPRHLQQHVRGGVVDLAGRAAHDAGQADRHVVAVADQQVLGGEVPLDVVEGGEPLAVACHPHPEPRARDLGEVVGVVRLAQLEHDVVRHVDHVADRPHAEQRQAGRELRIAGPRRRHRAGSGPRSSRSGPGRGSRRTPSRSGRPARSPASDRAA